MVRPGPVQHALPDPALPHQCGASGRVPQAVSALRLGRRRSEHHGEPRHGVLRPPAEPAHRAREEAGRAHCLRRFRRYGLAVASLPALAPLRRGRQLHPTLDVKFLYFLLKKLDTFMQKLNCIFLEKNF